MSSSNVVMFLRRCTERLEARGIETPRLDAELLLARVLETTRLGLYVRFDQPLSEREIAACWELVSRREERVPVAYLLGEKEFMGESFLVNGSVLIPRPDTETLVGAALRRIRQEGRGKCLLDVGTGTGCIALSLLRFGAERAVATDVCAQALNLARENAGRLGVAQRVRFIQCDLAEGIGEMGRIDLVVANLPYVSVDAMRDLSPEIRLHEPRIALEAGPTGLETIERFIASLRGRLIPGTPVLLEVGMGQAQAVKGLMEAAGLAGGKVTMDLGGVDRVVEGTAINGIRGSCTGRWRHLDTAQCEDMPPEAPSS